MPGPEATEERAVVKEAKAAGWLVRKVRFLDCNGAPDRLFGRDRRGIFIEFKAPGEAPSAQQTRRHKELRDDFGFEVYWVDSASAARAILGLPFK